MLSWLHEKVSIKNQVSMRKNVVNFVLLLSLMAGGVSLAFVPSAIAQNRPQIPSPASSPHNCGSMFLREFFQTNGYRVDICQNQNQIFLIAKNLNNPRETFRSNARNRGNSSYVAHGQNGVSYFVDSFGLTVQINGRTVVQESIIRSN